MKMDFTSTIAAKNISNVTTTAPPPVGGFYDPLWAIVVRWTIGGIIVLVGKLTKVNKLAFLAFCRIVSEKVLKFRKLPTVSLLHVLCSSKKTDSYHIQRCTEVEITCTSLSEG